MWCDVPGKVVYKLGIWLRLESCLRGSNFFCRLRWWGTACYTVCVFFLRDFVDDASLLLYIAPRCLRLGKCAVIVIVTSLVDGQKKVKNNLTSC